MTVEERRLAEEVEFRMPRKGMIALLARASFALEDVGVSPFDLLQQAAPFKPGEQYRLWETGNVVQVLEAVFDEHDDIAYIVETDEGSELEVEGGELAFWGTPLEVAV